MKVGSHYTIDNKITLCNKKISKKTKPSKDCQKCIDRKDSCTPINDRLERFKCVVEQLGGNYVFEAGEHKAWWNDNANLYIAYGKLSNINVWLTQNWLYLK